MFDKGFFEVKEIATSEFGATVHLKGQELVRHMFAPEHLKEIASLIEGKTGPEARFASDVFEFAKNGIEKIKIKSKLEEGKDIITSDLKLYRGSTSRVLPGVAVLYTLALRGNRNGGNIYGHENLPKTDKKLYEVNKKPVDPEFEWIRKFGDDLLLKFVKIDDIKIEDGESVVNFDEDGYAKFGYDQTLMHRVIPDSIVFVRDSKRYGFKFPEDDKAAYEKALRDHGFGDSAIKKILKIHDNPHNPGWQADSMTIIDNVIRNANMEVEVYIDGEVKNYRTRDFFRYEPNRAIVVLKNGDGGKKVIPAPWKKALSLGFLNQGIWIRDPTIPYVG